MAVSAVRGKDNMRNYDLIMKMTDKELAKFLTEFIDCNVCEQFNKRFDRCDADSHFVCVKEYAEAIIVHWLNQQAEGVR